MILRTTLMLAALPLLLSGHALGNDAPSAPDLLDRVEVTAVRLQTVPEFDVPASIDTIDVDGRASRMGASVSEALDGVPGVSARERQNLAQDTQLSIRGFGARSTFGVRGIRLYADGIPATMPDGQGQLSHFSLAGAERIEVIRGPFSALHGNSSGGVIQIWSADGTAPVHGHVQAVSGSHGSHNVSASLRNAGQAWGYALAAGVFDTDGWRDHSAARRESFNARLHRDTASGARIDVVANHFNAPDAQDPLGQTWAQFTENPRQSPSVATQFNTRKSVRQDQVGVRHRQPVGEGHAVEWMAYGGQRQIEQFLALPVAAQINPLNSGGNIDLDNTFSGLDLRWSWSGQLAGRAVEFTAGSNADRQKQHRQGFENHLDGVLGVRGALRRDERNQVSNFDQFAQGWMRLSERWSMLAGIRRSRVKFRSADHYVTAGNPDDSGRVDYAETTPVFGVTLAPTEDLRLYVSTGRGFETPTFNELGYRTDGGAGLAFDLVPSRSRNLEVGAKWRAGSGAIVQAAMFRADTDDELAVSRNVGGRSSFRNVGRARRQGFELGTDIAFAQEWRLQLAWTWLDASFRDAFPVCNASGCVDPSVLVAAGTRIPGTVRQQGFVRLQWQPSEWIFAFEGVGMGDVYANDTGTARAPGYGVAHLEVAREWHAGALRGFARIDNVLDKAYVGSVIVNEGNGRFYESAPGRSLMVGLRWNWERSQP